MAAILVERILEKITTNMVFISKKDIKMAKKFKIYHNRKSILIYNSITMPEVVKSYLRLELSMKEDVRIIGNVSRVNKVKNPIKFIDIAREYYVLFPMDNTIFVWIGNGPLMDQATLLVRKYGLTGKVFFIGFRDNAEHYMAQFNLLLMTSIWEGIPITILEAIELKIPILSTDVGGICEIVGEKNVYGVKQANRDIALKLKDVHTPVCIKKFRMTEKYMGLYLSHKEGN